jgi:hypothetical protein
MGQSIRQEVVTTEQASRWHEVLARIPEYDFCHLPEFSRLAEENEQGQARLLVLQEGETVVALPVVLRQIQPGVAPGAGRTDVTSVYGYVGPIASQAVLPEGTQRRFAGFLEEYFTGHGVVCALSRLHPLLPQASLLGGYGEVEPIGWTLSIDLTTSEEEQSAAYRRNHRQDIRHLLEAGVTCTEVGLDYLDDFISMYYDTMDRVGASSQYYFSRRYFEHLFRDLPGLAHLFVCSAEGRPVAGGIFTLCRGIVQWYFSGTRNGLTGPPPTKLMFDVARRWAKQTGAHTLHLGGGVGSRRDSLYHFKSGFAKREHIYTMWRHIVDREAYAEICEAVCGRYQVQPAGHFFPLYRHPGFEEASARASHIEDRRRELHVPARGHPVAG